MMPMMPPQMSNPAMNQGMPAGMMACPCCGQSMPMPDNSMMAPNVPLPPGQVGIGAGGQPPSESGLLQALMGGGGAPSY